MIKGYYCFHHKSYLKKAGICGKELERFREELHELRQLRNAAVHREEVSASTIRRYARSTLDVLETLRRLGNEYLEEAYGSSLDRLFRNFWDVDSDSQAIASPSDLSETMRE
ncbi:hypothetical protein VC83_04549 [Pseudogymnoascus destructans]|uniref:Uncharacterized protein n=2 Tax=Pseudogymnoascus destructans TaxID=655981 RepID=L8G4P3_PSED2|nr:uncharacterized protein VC83_04549 [Pseudogymnoascus destructans]ELR08250.1 hypothetical protein GMDG_03051 [Pseudogymnoascus destructans 20631-21]OAF57314.1 hypothetical protein VC83_04549 [Pseudogymnoascus destructans]